MAISKKSWLGFGVEATSGTAITTPKVYHPTKSIMKGTKKTEAIKDERGNRDGTYAIVETQREGSTDPKGSWYNDTSPYFLLAALGSVSSAQPDATNLPTVYKHTFALADVPKTLTMFKGYDAATYIGAYAALEKFTLKVAEGKAVECDASFKHLYPTKYTGAALTPTFSSQQPFASYMPKITLGGTSTTDIEELQIEFDQKITMWYPAYGVMDFQTLYFGERNVKVDFTARFDNDSLYQKFLNRQDDSITLDIQGALLGTDASVNYYDELSITINEIHYDSMDHDLGKDNVLIKAKATAISTSASPLITAFVQNKVASYAQ